MYTQKINKFLVTALIFLVSISASGQSFKLKIIETTDSHGSIYPYDFLNGKSSDNSLAQIYSYVKSERENNDQETVLLSGGDILQGTPAVYYYNFEDTTVEHLYARVMNFMKYDAGTVGNHDIETGHKVYDRFNAELNFPWLAANAVDDETGEPYFKPYTIINRRGLKIAVLGLITPAIPNWLPPKIWEGMHFDDMIQTAKKWVEIIKEKEKPDLLIGLFHAGVDYTYGNQTADTPKNENATKLVAERVPGFDLVFAGHDHHGWNMFVKNVDGDSVLLMGGSSYAKEFAVAEFNIDYHKSEGKWEIANPAGSLLNSKEFAPNKEFMDLFSSEFETVKKYVSRPLGEITETISTRESIFGDSPFMDLIQTIQLDLSGADISFAAPLSFNTEIKKGTIYVKDMFKLYKYENLLYTMKLTGEEVKNYLEYSAENWFNQMKNENDHLLNFVKDENGNLVFSKRSNSPVLKERFYNFESAEGINYTVDVSKPAGERIEISSMSDGSKFDWSKTYTIAVNSYRGNGGGGHLTKGAGIAKSELASRIVNSTDKDLRYYMMKWIEKQGTVTPAVNNNWKIIPEEWAEKGRKKDWKLVFGNEDEK